MMNKRLSKHLSLVTAAALCITTVIPVGTAFAASKATSKAFTDTTGTAYESAVASLATQGIIDGYEDGTFRPEDNITRAEVSKLFSSIISGVYKDTDELAISDTERMSEIASKNFRDLSYASWATPYIGVSAALGIVSGYGDGTFAPSGYITYNELAAMAVRACDYEIDSTLSWPDNYIAAARKLKLFDGTVSDTSTDKWLIAGASEKTDGTGADATGDTDDLATGSLVRLAQASDDSTATTDGLAAGSLVRVAQVSDDSAATTDNSDATTAKAIDLDVEGSTFATRGNVAIVLNNALATIKEAAAAGYTHTSSTVDLSVVKELSLEEALEIMQTTGMNAETAKNNKNSDEALLRSYKDNVSSLKASLDAIDELPVGAAIEYQNQGITDTNLKAAKYTRDFLQSILDDNYQAELNSIEVTTLQMYYGIQQLEESLTNDQQNVLLQKKLLENVQLQNKLGTASDIQVSSQESALSSAKNTLAQTEQSLYSTKQQFVMLLGLPESTDLVLTTPIEKVDTSDLMSVDDAVASMKEKNLTLKYYNYLKEVTGITFNSLKYSISTSSTTYKQQKVQYESIITGLEQLEKSQETTLRTDYANLTELAMNIENFDTTIALCEKSLDVKNTQYAVGMATLSDVMSAEYDLSQAKLGRLAAIVSYNTAVSNLKLASGVGTSRVSMSAS